MPWEKVRVTGIKGFKGEIDGQVINSGRVFIEESFDSSRNSPDQFGEGTASTPYALGSVEAARPLLGMGLDKGPVVCEVEFARRTNGRESRTVVVGIRPVASSKAA